MNSVSKRTKIFESLYKSWQSDVNTIRSGLHIKPLFAKSSTRCRNSNSDSQNSGDLGSEESYARDAAWEASMHDTVLDDDLIEASRSKGADGAKLPPGLSKKLPELLFLDSQTKNRAPKKRKAAAEPDLWLLHDVQRSEVLPQRRAPRAASARAPNHRAAMAIIRPTPRTGNRNRLADSGPPRATLRTAPGRFRTRTAVCARPRAVPWSRRDHCAITARSRCNRAGSLRDHGQITA